MRSCATLREVVQSDRGGGGEGLRGGARSGRDAVRGGGGRRRSGRLQGARRREARRHGRVGAPRRRHEHHRALRRLAPALRHPLRDHHGHPRRGRRQRRRQRDRPGARPAARERGPRRALPVGHRRHLQPRPRRLLLQPQRAADPVLLAPGRDAAADHADHPHDAAGDLHRLHADAQRGPRQPPAGRPLHLGGRARRGGPVDVPGAAAGRGRALHVAGQEGLLRRQHAGHRRHDDRARLHGRLRPGGDEPRHGRGRLDRLRLAVRLARGQRPGSAGRLAEELVAGRARGHVRVPDAEPDDVQGDVRRPAARASA